MKKTQEPGQHGIRQNSKVHKLREANAQKRYEAMKRKPAPIVDMEWMKNVPTGLEPK